MEPINEEKWIFAMGALTVSNYNSQTENEPVVLTYGGDDPMNSYYKSFKL